MSRQLGLFVALVALLHNSVQSPVSELKSVIVLYRHGDRAPAFTYPTDLYDESYWPFGFGELTNIGKNQHYELGKWFRNRFSNFLSRRFLKTDITVRASNVNRCLMSAASNLAGLYPPVADQVWNPDLKWQPIPIHTTPETNDPYLAQGASCPKYNRLFSELMETAKFKKIFEENKDLFEYISVNSGIEVSSITDFYMFYDTFHIQSLYNLTLPDWADRVYNDENIPLILLFWKSVTYTKDLARLRAGPLLDLIAGQFENVTNNVESTTKFLMLSAHDSTVASVLTSLNIFDDQSPPYASSLILELRERRGVTFVNIFYKKFDTVSKLTLPGCGFDCSLSRFTKILEPLRVNVQDWTQECQG